MNPRVLAAAFGTSLAIALNVMAQPSDSPLTSFKSHGKELFAKRCASCHDPAQGRAPDKAALGQRSPEELIQALTAGPMAPMAQGLADMDMVAVAYFVTGRLPGAPAMEQAADPPSCATNPPFTMEGSGWNGWSIDPRNWRLQPDPGLTRANVPHLKVKWAMTYVGGRYGQPAVVGRRLFLTSGGGKAYSLDPRTGCVFWRIDVPGGARTSVVIGPLKSAPSGYAAYFGDGSRNVWAVDAHNGATVWKVSVDDHPLGTITGSPTLYGGRLYVPLSSYEEGLGDVGSYGCCTHRGSIAALDAATGKLVWKTYAIGATPHPTRKNTAGTQMFGPAGAAIWSAPTIDAKRGLVYVGTGDSYTDEPTDGSDAVMAIDLASGAVRWRHQMTVGDNFLNGCGEPQKLGANCPHTLGLDLDFGAPPILVPLSGGGDILLAGQKSGVVYGLDPGSGKVLWSHRVGAGSGLGGVEWGMAFDAKRLYVANADPFAVDERVPVKPGLSALDPATGKALWTTPTPQVPCSFHPAGHCFNAQSAPPTVIPGVVFSTTTDGRLRAYDPADGRIIWDFDTGARKYATINGVTDQSGGSLDATGPTVAGGMLFVISGYLGVMGGVANNVLLAFSVDGK